MKRQNSWHNVFGMTNVFIATSLLSAAGRAFGETTPVKLPNIVFILADDLGYGDVGCYNSDAKIPTPHLDRLAKEGMRFSDGHAPCTVCTPSRYSILTGRYSWRTRQGAKVLWSWDKPLIEENRLTVPVLLKQHGYRTAAIGKWHLGMNWPFATPEAEKRFTGYFKDQNNAVSADFDWSKPIAGGPTTRGFDYYFGVNCPNFPPYAYIENDRIMGAPPLAQFGRLPDIIDQYPGPGQEGFDRTQIEPTLARKACEWIEKSAKTDQPFFLYFALTVPHSPILPLETFTGKSGAGPYGDFVMQMDATVGRVLETLEHSGVANDTLVIFTSDNGPTSYTYEVAREYRHFAMGSLRGVKRSTWEGGHRVPFIVRWPGQVPAGQTCDEMICQVDLLATIAGLVGARLPSSAGEDSYNLLPVLFGEKLTEPLREALVYHHANDTLAIRQGKWVLIDARTGEGEGQEPDWFKKERGYQSHNLTGELFDLSQDLEQRRNLYTEHPEIVKRLKALLEKYKNDGRSAPLCQ